MGRRLWVGAGWMGATAIMLWPRHTPGTRSGIMGGFSVLGWLVIGAAAGWTITQVMVTAQGHAIRGTVAGIVGGILGGFGMDLFQAPWARANDLDTLLAALAGSLWLAWITCALTSGRERSSRHHPLVIAPLDVHRPRSLGEPVLPLSASVRPV